MKAVWILAVFAFATGTAAAPRPHKDCFGASDVSCSGYPQTAIITHSSLCAGQPQPDCQVVSASYGRYVEALQTWWSKGQQVVFCHPHSLARLARQVSAAIAEVWSSAKARVSCEGHGEACGYTLGSADDYAEAISESLAQAAARVVAGDFCYADLRATANSLVEALAEADHGTCERGSGSLESWRTAYVEAVAPAVEVAFAAATANTCTGDLDAARGHKSRHLTAMPMMTSQCASAAGMTQPVELGNVCAGIDQDIPECEGDAGDACCGQDEELSLCACENCNGPWLRKSGPGSSMKIFQDIDRHRCTCEFKDKCEGAPNYGCSAFDRLMITAIAGHCTGAAQVNCKTVEDATDEYRRVMQDWLVDDGEICSYDKLQAAAQAIGNAAATIYADAANQISCKRKRFACGWVQANGLAWAQAFSEAVAISTARAHDEAGHSKKICYADIRDMARVVAAVTKRAQTRACSSRASPEQYRATIAKYIGMAVTQTFEKAVANSCPDISERHFYSLCEGPASAPTGDGVFEMGTICAGITVAKPCTGPGNDMCCDIFFMSSYCHCGLEGCDNSPWMLDHVPWSHKTFFKDVSGNICFCE